MKALKSIKRVMTQSSKQLGVKDVRAKESIVHEGFLRKKSHSMMGMARDVMHMKWGIFYVLVTTRSIYYFKSETSTSLVGKLSLCGYNVVRRVSAPAGSTSVWPEFSFMVQHASPDSEVNKNYVFAATNPTEFKIWMVNIREAMVAANQQMLAGISLLSVSSSTDISLVEEPIYPSSNFMPAFRNNQDDGACDSDDSDYTEIDAPDSSEYCSAEIPPPRPKKTIHSEPPSTESYIEIPELGPAPFSPAKLVSPLSGRHHPNPFAAELEARMANDQHGVLTSTMPTALAPTPPVNRPPIAVKPVLHVKPRMLAERMFWNGTKEEATRRMRSLPTGMFCLRAGQTCPVIVIAAGNDEPPHSLRIFSYSNGTMGLKSETTVTEEEKFTSLSALVNYYKANNIHLRNGAVAVMLTTSPADCDTELT